MKNHCKSNPCCGDPYDCKKPYEEPAPKQENEMFMIQYFSSLNSIKKLGDGTRYIADLDGCTNFAMNARYPSDCCWIVPGTVSVDD